MMQLKRGALAGLIAMFCLTGIAAAADIPAEDAGLNPTGKVYDVNRDAVGGVVLSDYGAGEVWRVAADTGATTRYAGLPTPIDARADRAGDIWWVNYDYGAELGRINVEDGTVTTWDFHDWNPDWDYYLSGLAFDSAGRVWISEDFGNNSKLYRFNPESKDLCAYEIPGGTVSTYVVQRQGLLWMANWYTARLMRFDPDSRQVAWWQLPAGVVEGLALDGSGNAWLADPVANEIYRLGAGQLTRFALPAGAGPHTLAVAGQTIWYSAGGEGINGTVGKLDPSLATGVISTPLAGAQTVSTPICAGLGDGATIPLSTDPGTLSWTESTWTTLVDSDGWQVYELPDDPPRAASPYGIAAAWNYLWVGDSGRQMLARTAVTTVNEVYLPLIVRQ
jgi:streptogramin lyase